MDKLLGSERIFLKKPSMYAFYALGCAFLGVLLWVASLQSVQQFRQALEGMKDEFFKAIELNKIDKVEHFLKYQPDLVGVQDGLGRTPLHLAAQHDRKKIAQMLLAVEGIDIHAQDQDGATPLHTAAEWDRMDVADVLLGDRRISVNIRDAHGKTPLHYSVRLGEGVAKKLLQHQNIDSNARDNTGFTPLHEAVLFENDDFMKILLGDLRVNVNAQDNSGATPLYQAVSDGKKGMIWQLLRVPGIDITIKTQQGKTALEIAQENRHYDIAIMLLWASLKSLIPNWEIFKLGRWLKSDAWLNRLK